MDPKNKPEFDPTKSKKVMNLFKKKQDKILLEVYKQLLNFQEVRDFLSDNFRFTFEVDEKKKKVITTIIRKTAEEKAKPGPEKEPDSRIIIP